LAENLARMLGTIPALARYAEPMGLGIVVLGITYLSLILGELVPKRIAMQNPERISALTALPMRWLSALASPVVSVLSVSTELVLRVLGHRSVEEPPVTEHEIKAMIEQGKEAGVFAPAEQEMIVEVFRFGDRTAASLMTPRPDIVWIDRGDPPGAVLEKLREQPRSCLPVCRGDLDHIEGVLHAKDALAGALEGRPPDWEKGLRKPVFLPETVPAPQLLEAMRDGGTHLVFVVDEHGVVQGLVTLHDILEAIVGDLPAGGGTEAPAAVRREDGSWLVDGMIPMDELKERLGVARLPGEEAGGFRTLGGYAMMRMGRVPSAGDHFEAGGLRFEIVDMDGRRVDKVLVTVLPAAPVPN
jgi:putative hemolysin